MELSPAQQLYTGIGQQLPDSEASQMFGKPCFKIHGKAYLAFFSDCMVFKLTGEQHKAAIQLSGAVFFDPSGKGRAMKEWVQLPVEHQHSWLHFARAAHSYALQTSKRMQ